MGESRPHSDRPIRYFASSSGSGSSGLASSPSCQTPNSNSTPTFQPQTALEAQQSIPAMVDSKSPYGILSIFPAELILLIVSAENLDVPSIFNLRRANRAFKAIVDENIPEYKLLVEKYSKLLCKLVNTRATFPACRAVHALVTSDEPTITCSRCSSSSPLTWHSSVYLPTAEWVCYGCPQIYIVYDAEIPWSELHLKKHLQEQGVDWAKDARRHMLPSVRLRLPHPHIDRSFYTPRRECTGLVQPHGLLLQGRPTTFYDAQAVAKHFNISRTQ